jgi:Domain of unknown function (DUF1772)
MFTPGQTYNALNTPKPQLYDIGKKTVPAISLCTALALGVAAYLAHPVPGNFISENRKAYLEGATLLSMGNVVFTVAVMMPGIRRLKAAEARILKGLSVRLAHGRMFRELTWSACMSVTGEDGKEDCDDLIIKWSNQHNVRIVFTLATFLASVAELVSVA